MHGIWDGGERKAEFYEDEDGSMNCRRRFYCRLQRRQMLALERIDHMILQSCHVIPGIQGGEKYHIRCCCSENYLVPFDQTYYVEE